MNNPMTRAAMLILAVLVACWFLPGCSDLAEPEPKPNPNPDPNDIVNPDKPNSNDQIVADTTMGDAGTWSTLRELAMGPAGEYNIRGAIDGHSGVGRLSASGAPAWFFRTAHTPMGISASPSGGAVPNGLIVAGKQDVDGDGESDIGFASLLSSGGSLMSQLVYSADTSDVWLNSIVHISDSTFLVVGGVKALAVEHPFIATIVLTSGGQLEKRHQAVISALTDRVFSDPAVDPSLSAGSSWSFYVTSSDPDGNYAVHKIAVALPELATWTVDWSYEVSVPSMQKSRVYDMCFFGGNLYVAGEIDDPDKTPLPSGGGYWKSGLAASLTSAGDLRWIKVVQVTQHSDALHSVAASLDGVYAVGKCAEFVRQDQYFGYGWISKLSESTGEVDINRTFGDEKYQSGFNDGILEGSTFHCCGWTRREVSGVYQGWFCDVDISATFSGSPVTVPARMAAGDRAVLEDRQAGTGSN